MEKKKQKTIRIVISSILLISIGYVSIYWFLLKDEYTKYLFQIVSLENIQEPNTKISTRIKIYKYENETCKITYYILNNDYKNITFPCDKLKKNDYTNEGQYKINIYFDSYPLYPGSFLGMNLRKRLDSWEIIKSEESSPMNSSSEYIKGIKEVIEQKTFMESLSCLIPSNSFSLEKWICNKGDYLTNDYLQSLYLSYELGLELNDEDFKRYVVDEINYLNSNMQAILEGVHIYPEANILKLVNIGLNKEFLDIIDRNNIPKESGIFENIKLEFNHCFGEENISNTDILSLEKSLEYAKIFKEFNYTQLSNYYLNELYRINTEVSPNFTALCYIGSATRDVEIANYVSDCINEEKNRLGIESLSFEELYTCSQFLGEMNLDIRKIGGYLFDKVQKATITYKGNSFFVDRSSSIFVEGKTSPEFPLNFKILNNLKYIHYAQDK